MAALESTPEVDESEDEFYDADSFESSPTPSSPGKASTDDASADESADTVSSVLHARSAHGEAQLIDTGDLAVEDVFEVEVVPTPKGKTLIHRTSIVVLSNELSEEAVLLATSFKNLDSGEVMTLAEGVEKVAKAVDPLTMAMDRRHDKADADADASSKPKSGGKPKHSGASTKGKFMRLLKGDKKSSGMGAENPVPKGVGDAKGGSKNTVQLVQTLGGGVGESTWAMEFSLDGRLLAAAGKDGKVQVWCVCGEADHFQDIKRVYGGPGQTESRSEGGSLNAPSTTSLDMGGISTTRSPSMRRPKRWSGGKKAMFVGGDVSVAPLFESEPWVVFEGHTADVLDMSWSKNYFLLTSSMDKTVRLWHIAHSQCLCCFQHPDFVTAIAFHPTDDRYFISASLDMRLRLWSIPQKKVALWSDVNSGPRGSLITAANFVQGGKMVAVGTYDGRCLFYDSERLKYHTQISVKREGKKTGKKISGIIPLDNNRILVTSNDSRIRVYNMMDYGLEAKFRGHVNTNSQIRAAVSHDGAYVVSGSEDGHVYIWGTSGPEAGKQSDRKRQSPVEVYNVHTDTVTVAMFPPKALLQRLGHGSNGLGGGYLISADASGRICVTFNPMAQAPHTVPEADSKP